MTRPEEADVLFVPALNFHSFKEQRSDINNVEFNLCLEGMTLLDLDVQLSC